jgi:hypothetical protein
MDNQQTSTKSWKKQYRKHINQCTSPPLNSLSSSEAKRNRSSLNFRFRSQLTWSSCGGRWVAAASFIESLVVGPNPVHKFKQHVHNRSDSYWANNSGYLTHECHTMRVVQWCSPTILIHDRQPFGAKAASTLRGETFPNHNHLHGISEFVIHLQIIANLYPKFHPWNTPRHIVWKRFLSVRALLQKEIGVGAKVWHAPKIQVTSRQVGESCPQTWMVRTKNDQNHRGPFGIELWHKPMLENVLE